MPFTGQIAEIPVGVEGLTGNVNQALIRPTQLLEANNITYESGTLRKEGGAAKYNSSAITGTPSVIGGWDWFPTSGTQRMIVVLSDGDIQKDTGAGDFTVTLKAGLTVSGIVPVFVEAGAEVAANNRKLFICTGSNQIQVLSADGATTADIANPAADWGSTYPTFGANHEGRTWFGGNSSDPHRVYYSELADHEDHLTGVSGGSISIYPGEGEKLIGMISFKGLLICWKFPIGIYVVDTTNVIPAEWRVDKISQGVGLASPLAVTQISDDVLFIDAVGNFHLLSGIREFGAVAASAVSELQNFGDYMRTNIDIGALSNCRSIYYDAKQEAHFACQSINGSVNDRRIVVDFNIPGTVRFRSSDRDTPESLWLRRDGDDIQRPTLGDDGGFVWNLDQTSRSQDGAGYNGQFQTAHLDLSFLDPSLATVQKNGQFLELIVEPKGNWTLAVDILWDNILTETVTFSMGSAGAVLGSFVLDTDTLASDAILNTKRRITGQGRRISLRGSNNGDAQDFSVGKFLLHFTIGDERL